MGADYKTQIRPIIDVVDYLRRLGVDRYVSLPSIVVVGDQSAGKSSVLEALSGVQLPRGTGIVTRCPTEIRLKNSKGGWRARLSYDPNDEERGAPEMISRETRDEDDTFRGGENPLMRDQYDSFGGANEAPQRRPTYSYLRGMEPSRWTDNGLDERANGYRPGEISYGRERGAFSRTEGQGSGGRKNGYRPDANGYAGEAERSGEQFEIEGGREGRKPEGNSTLREAEEGRDERDASPGGVARDHGGPSRNGRSKRDVEGVRTAGRRQGGYDERSGVKRAEGRRYESDGYSGGRGFPRDEIYSGGDHAPWIGEGNFRRNQDISSLQYETISHPSQVADRILRLQNLLAGDKKQVSRSLIHLEIESPDVPDLTLIDLPGITRVPTTGQQEDACNIIRETIESYIRREGTIILAVVPANVDIATSEALKMAREVDPSFRRTIGVITKPDMIAKGDEDEVMRVVTNERYRLLLGYTLVKCRSQDEVKNRLSLRDAVIDEQRYFKTHPHFQQLPENLLGIKNLSKKLHEVLVEHIKEMLPGIKSQIGEMIDPLQAEIDKLGEGLPNDKEELKKRFLQVLMDCADAIKDVAKGLDLLEMDSEEHPDLNAYRKAYPFFHQYCKIVEQIMPGKANQEFVQKIRETIVMHRGRELLDFQKYPAFEHLVKEIVHACKSPAQQCLTEVTGHIGDIFHGVVQITLGQYQDLERNVQDRISHQLVVTKRDCDKQLEMYFKMEALVYTERKFYSAAVDSRDGEVRHQAQPSSEETTVAIMEDSDMMCEAVLGYLDVCIRRIMDMVPMMILHFMIRLLAENVRNDVLTLVHDENNGVRLLAEQRNIAEYRGACRQKLERLTKAQEELRKYSFLTV